MYKSAIQLFICFSASISLWAQEALTTNWQLVHSFAIGSQEKWSVDMLENFYASHDGVLVKYDSSGVIKFRQSIKSLGNLEQLVPINTMKLVHFSTEQQSLCFFDNTLSISENCMDLSEKEIYNAKTIAASSRPDKIWIVDNVNSKLLLLDVTGKDQQTLETENLNGILDLNAIDKILEKDEKLFALDKTKGIYSFDMYGSLLDFFAESDIIDFDVQHGSLILLKDDQLVLWDLSSGVKTALKTPCSKSLELVVMNNNLFLRTSENVYKYRLQF